MNTEETRARLIGQRALVYGAMMRFENAKAKLDAYDAGARVKIRADGVKRTESDVDAMVISDPQRAPLEAEMIASKAEMESLKVDTQCLLAQASLDCAEVAAMSRISQ